MFMRSILFLLLSASIVCSGAWYWPFGSSKKKKAPAPSAPVTMSSKFLPTNGDASEKIHPKIAPNAGVSVEKVKELADAGNANAQLTLGRIYFEGLVGEKQDYKKAFK